MKNQNMPEKKIQIFKGLFKLIKQGKSPESIKVSDIALEADIGKGTVYQYFTSKEEIISQALLYHINRSFVSITEKMHRFNTFEERIRSVMDIVEQRVSLIPSSVGLLFFNTGVGSLRNYLQDEEDKFKEFHSIIAFEVDEIVKLGINEGIIDKDIDFKYARHVFSSAMMSYFGVMSCDVKRAATDISQLKDYTYTMIVKSLS